MRQTTRLLIILLLIAIAGCKSIRESKRFSKCEFKVKRLSTMIVGGINFMHKRDIRNFSVKEGLSLAKQVSQKNLPVKLAFLVWIRNPNKEKAALDGFDYQVEIDGKLVLDGRYDYRTEIDGLSEAAFQAPFSFELMDVVNKTDYRSIINLVLGLINERHEPVNVTLKMKPYITVLGKRLKYPNYLSLDTQYK